MLIVILIPPLSFRDKQNVNCRFCSLNTLGKPGDTIFFLATIIPQAPMREILSQEG